MAIDVPQVMTLDQLQSIYERPALVQPATSARPDTAAAALEAMKDGKNEAAKARAQAIVESGLSVGIKAGLGYQLQNISTVIDRRKRALDTTYSFSTLMIHDRVVPPVITEARDLYNQDGDYALRLSGAHYKIEVQPRFSSVAPTWRDYLSFPRAGIDRSALSAALVPQTDAEKQVWRLSVNDGWRQGVAQANLMLNEAMDRMNRDLLGMMRFHRFVMEGKITMPAIASSQVAVTRKSNSMTVDETLLRITTLPEFNGQMSDWHGAALPSAGAAPTINVRMPDRAGEGAQ